MACGKGWPRPPIIIDTVKFRTFTVTDSDSMPPIHAEVVWDPFVPYAQTTVPFVPGGAMISFGGAWLSSTGPTDGCWLFPPDGSPPLTPGCYYPHPVERVPGSMYHVRQLYQAEEVSVTDTFALTFMWVDSIGQDLWNTEVDLIFQGPEGDTLRSPRGELNLR
jgi:hypothetical protein